MQRRGKQSPLQSVSHLKESWLDHHHQMFATEKETFSSFDYFDLLDGAPCPRSGSRIAGPSGGKRSAPKQQRPTSNRPRLAAAAAPRTNSAVNRCPK